MTVPKDQLCAVWYGGTDFRVERRPIPAIGPSEVLLEVALCGVCGSDVHIVAGEFPMYDFPRVLGHEYSGTVRAVGRDVRSVKPGDAVVIDPSTSCGGCFFCREGLPLLCVNRSLHHGGMGQYTTAPEQAVYVLPAGVTLEAAALAEPLSCALHAVSLAGVRPGDRVAIVGAGAIGLLLLQLARKAGATRLLVSDPTPERRQMARRLGADVLVDPGSEDLFEAARRMTDGIGVDAAIEAVGSGATVADCIALPRRGGTAVLMGVAGPHVEVPIRPYNVYERELTIRGAFIRSYEFRRAVELLPHLELQGLITDRFPLSQAPDALENVRQRRGIKTAIVP